MRWYEEKPIAHRGLHGPDRPENSIAAFEAALDAGYPVELDVRLSRDGVPVVYHDATLGRLTAAAGAVTSMSVDQLTDLNLADSEERIPRFTAVLERIGGAVPLLVELKTRRRLSGLEPAVAAALETYDGPVAIQSFNPVSLAWFRRHHSRWPRGQLAGPTDLPRYQRVLLERLALTWLSWPDFVAYQHESLPYWPVRIHRRVGLPVLAWTVRTTAALRRVDRHADNVIFERIRP